jgi:hypothetical protein
MPCPFFQPLQPAPNAPFSHARLPLIEAYSGHCSGQQPGTVVEYQRCNQGYARDTCEHVPASEGKAANRYTFAGRTADEIAVLFVREEDCKPASTRLLHYSLAQGKIVDSDVERNIYLQAEAFCRSYLRREHSRPTATRIE